MENPYRLVHTGLDGLRQQPFGCWSGRWCATGYHVAPTRCAQSAGRDAKKGVQTHIRYVVGQIRFGCAVPARAWCVFHFDYADARKQRPEVGEFTDLVSYLECVSSRPIFSGLTGPVVHAIVHQKNRDRVCGHQDSDSAESPGEKRARDHPPLLRKMLTGPMTKPDV